MTRQGDGPATGSATAMASAAGAGAATGTATATATAGALATGAGSAAGGLRRRCAGSATGDFRLRCARATVALVSPCRAVLGEIVRIANHLTEESSTSGCCARGEIVGAAVATAAGMPEAVTEVTSARMAMSREMMPLTRRDLRPWPGAGRALSSAPPARAGAAGARARPRRRRGSLRARPWEHRIRWSCRHRRDS